MPRLTYVRKHADAGGHNQREQPSRWVGRNDDGGVAAAGRATSGGRTPSGDAASSRSRQLSPRAYPARQTMELGALGLVGGVSH
jgi:hypothetical protein